MIVLIHNILPPYRQPLFDEIFRQTDGNFRVLVSRVTHKRRRRWTPPDVAAVPYVKVLRTVGLEMGHRALDLSWGTASHLRGLNPDLIILAGWDVAACWSALAWGRRRGVPLAAWVESSSGTGEFRGILSRRLRGLFLENCQGAIVPGEAAAAFVRSLSPHISIFEVPNAVSPGLPSTQRGRPHSDLDVLFVGELSWRKGVDVILAAVPQLAHLQHRVDLVGDGPLRRQAQLMSERYPTLRVHGFIEGNRLKEMQAAAKVVLIPSRQDPWPLVAPEALNAGVPVVLGPGVSSAPDLAKVAGPAVVQMLDASPSELLRAIKLARVQQVSMSAREVFLPSRVATKFLRVATEIPRVGM